MTVTVITTDRHCLRHIKLTQENPAAFNKMARKRAIINISASVTAEYTAEALLIRTLLIRVSGFTIQACKNNILNS